MGYFDRLGIAVTVADAADACEEAGTRIFCAIELFEHLSRSWHEDIVSNAIAADTTGDKDRIRWFGIALDSAIDHLRLTKALADAGYTAGPAAEGAAATPLPHNDHLQVPWDRALGQYQAASDLAAEARSTSEQDVATADHANAFKYLLNTRVPHLDALREKVRIIRNELGEVTQHASTQLLADIDRLN